MIIDSRRTCVVPDCENVGMIKERTKNKDDDIVVRRSRVCGPHLKKKRKGIFVDIPKLDLRKYKEVKDSKRKCTFPGCENVGAHHGIKNNRVRRSNKCLKHSNPDKFSNHGRKGVAARIFYDQHGQKCQYCGWEGPCDIHRPVPATEGGKYVEGNMVAVCPNCHRLLTYGYIKDKTDVSDL